MRKGEIITSNFSFSQNVFHKYISLACQNAVLCGNGLTFYDDILLDWTRFKALILKTTNQDIANIMISDFDREEKHIVEKRENAGYQRVNSLLHRYSF